MGRETKPSCSPLLVRPFARMLRGERIAAGELGTEIDAIEASAERLPVASLQELVAKLVARTGDPALGLRAAMYTEIGDFEVLEWVAMSADTWRAANQVACRFARILNDAAEYRFEVRGQRSHLMLGSAVPLQRAAADYQLAAYHLAVQLRVRQLPPDFEVWFQHPAPDDLAPYAAVFPGAKLVFSAEYDGFASDAGHLDMPMPSANPSLHRVLLAHADRVLAELAPGDSLVERVTADILATMRDGDATADHTAARLGMARRTLTRQLADRGTSFSDLLQQARHRTAIHYLCNTSYSVEDIAFLLGFSDCPPFVRAFKRWSGGHSPLRYRQLHIKPR